MNGNDRRSEPEWPIRPEQSAPAAEATSPTKRRGRVHPILLALGGLVLLLLLLWLFTGNRSADQDKLIGNETGEARTEANAEQLCGSRGTYDLIKRQLFRQAAQVRGSDQAAFDRLSAYAVIRVENPVLEREDEDTGAAHCSGSLALDLPPGVAVVGGRRTLTSDIDYTVQRAADGSGNVVLLRNAEAIVTPLATLARVAQPNAQQNAQPPLAPSEGGAPADPTVPGAPVPPAAAEPRATPPRETQPSSARPSFNCGAASTRGEIAVCRDAGLASLDRQMSAQFYRALERADPQQRALLQRTRARFLSYRDGCRSNSCIADAYRGRMREISDIMSGRWQPPR